MAERISEAMVEAATREYLSHKGERPERILRGGYALWEANAEAMRAALEAALSAAPASAQMEGMVLVPREPTEAHIEMLTHIIRRSAWGRDNVIKQYKELLAK